MTESSKMHKILRPYQQTVKYAFGQKNFSISLELHTIFMAQTNILETIIIMPILKHQTTKEMVKKFLAEIASRVEKRDRNGETPSRLQESTL